MKEVIEKYKKFVFVYTLINLFALLVNLFNIKGNFVNGFILTSRSFNRGTWPFVSYIDTYYKGSSSGPTYFTGIFYQYDISEFLLYMGILLSFLIYKAYIIVPQIKKKVPSV